MIISFLNILKNFILPEPLTPSEKDALYKKTWCPTAIYKFWHLTANGAFDESKLFADSLNQDQWKKLWNFFNSASDEKVSRNEFSSAIQTLESQSNKMNVSSCLSQLPDKFWNTAGFNVDDSVAYDDFRNLMTAFAIVDAQTIIQVTEHFELKG